MPSLPALLKGKPDQGECGGIVRNAGGLAVAADGIDGGTVYCDPGQHVVGGGYATDGGSVFVNAPTPDRTGWTVALDNTGYPAATLDGYALCAGDGQAVAASVQRSGKLAPLNGTLKRLVEGRRSN